MGDVGTHTDVEIALHAWPGQRGVEHRGDVLGVLVIGGHAEADQPIGGGQTIEDVDAHAGAAGQVGHRVARRGTGTDDRHP